MTKTAILPLALLLGCQVEQEWSCDISDPRGRVARIDTNEIGNADRWSTVELWRAGGLDDEGAQLTMPTSARVRSDGTLAIPDFESGDVWLLDRDGRWLDPVAGRGQGPGELLNPLAVVWTPEGDLLALDASQAKIERYDLETGRSETRRIPADLLGPIFRSGEIGWFGLRGDGVAFVELPSEGPDARAVTFARAGPTDEARVTAWETEYPAGRVPAYDRPSLPEWPRALLAVGGERWVVAPGSDIYELIVLGPANEAEFHLCISDREVFGRPDGEVPSWLAEDISELSSAGSEALFARILLDHDDRIWIERDLPMPGAPFDRIFGVAGAHLDVLSSDGTFLARVKLPPDLRFQDARGDTLWAFAIGEFAEVEVIAARIVTDTR